MGIITRLNSSNLFWLGRYTERVFTTLDAFLKYFDIMIDKDHDAYIKYLEDLGLPNIYADSYDFIDHYVFDSKDFNSIRANYDRAIGNGIILREGISSTALSYLQIGLDRLKTLKGTPSLSFDLLSVTDSIYAFWGSLENNMVDLEARELIYLGKAIERLDLYLRLSYPQEDIQRAFDYLESHLFPKKIDTAAMLNEYNFKELLTALEKGTESDENRMRALSYIQNLIEVNKSEEAAL